MNAVLYHHGRVDAIKRRYPFCSQCSTITPSAISRSLVNCGHIFSQVCKISSCDSFSLYSWYMIPEYYITEYNDMIASVFVHCVVFKLYSYLHHRSLTAVGDKFN